MNPITARILNALPGNTVFPMVYPANFAAVPLPEWFLVLRKAMTAGVSDYPGLCQWAVAVVHAARNYSASTDEVKELTRFELPRRKYVWPRSSVTLVRTSGSVDPVVSSRITEMPAGLRLIQLSYTSGVWRAVIDENIFTSTEDFFSPADKSLTFLKPSVDGAWQVTAINSSVNFGIDTLQSRLDTAFFDQMFADLDYSQEKRAQINTASSLTAADRLRLYGNLCECLVRCAAGLERL